MLISKHEMTIRTIALAMAFADGQIDLIHGSSKFTAVLDRASKSIRDVISKKTFSSAFKWALYRFKKERISTSKLLFIGGFTVKDWMQKIDENNAMVTSNYLCTFLCAETISSGRGIQGCETRAER